VDLLPVAAAAIGGLIALGLRARTLLVRGPACLVLWPAITVGYLRPVRPTRRRG
jgi:hypothetical protein